MATNSIDKGLYLDDLSCALEKIPKLSNLNGASILITGASGLVGSVLVDMLRAYNQCSMANIKIYAMSRSINHLRMRFGIDNHNSSLSYIVHDINDKLDFSSLHIDYIVHAAGNAFPALFREDPVGTLRSSVIGTDNMLDYGMKSSVSRFVLVSSGEVYGQKDNCESPFLESDSYYIDSMNPRSCYPIGKRASETLCMSYSKQYHMDISIARLCHIYGPNAVDSDNRAITQFFHNVLCNEDIHMSSTGMQLRSYLYVCDAASAILAILINGAADNAYNVADSMSRITIADLAHVVADYTDRNVVFDTPTNNQLSERTFIPWQVLDSSKLEALGWESAFSLSEGILHTLKLIKAL